MFYRPSNIRSIEISHQVIVHPHSFNMRVDLDSLINGMDTKSRPRARWRESVDVLRNIPVMDRISVAYFSLA